MQMLLFGVVPAFVELEDIEGASDGGDAVEDGFVAFAVPEGEESAFLNEVLEEWSATDVVVAFAHGEVALVREWGFAHD